MQKARIFPPGATTTPVFMAEERMEERDEGKIS